MPMRPPARDWPRSLREDQAAFVLADELGFSEGYVGACASDDADCMAYGMLFLASLAGKVKWMRLGCATVNLPQAEPAHLAARIAMLDQLLGGRLTLGIAAGGFPPGSASDPSALPLDAIETVLKLWSGDLPGATGQLDAGERPLRRRVPPVVVTAVAPFCAGVETAAARGWDPISAHFLLPRGVASHRDGYLAGCARGGRGGDLANWRVARSIFVADDLNVARDYARGPRSPYVAYYGRLMSRLGESGRAGLFRDDLSEGGETLTLDDVLDRLVIWGTPDKVADELEALRDRVGAFGTLLYAGHEWADANLARRSMILLAEKVRPRLGHTAEAAE